MRLCERPLPPPAVVFKVLVDSWRSCRREERTERVRDALLAVRKLSMMDKVEEEESREGRDDGVLRRGYFNVVFDVTCYFSPEMRNQSNKTVFY